MGSEIIVGTIRFRVMINPFSVAQLHPTTGFFGCFQLFSSPFHCLPTPKTDMIISRTEVFGVTRTNHIASH